MPSQSKWKKKEQKHIRGAFKPVVTQTGPLSKPLKVPERRRQENVTTSSFPVSQETSEKLRRNFIKHHIPVHLKPTTTLRQKLVHRKDKTPRHKQNKVVYVVQCSQDS